MARTLRPTIFDKLDFERYFFKEYPKMLYADGKKPVVVQSEQEERALEGEWFTTPREVKK